MLIDGVRLRWGVETKNRRSAIVLTFSIQDVCERFTMPFEPGEPIGKLVTDAIDVLVNSGVIGRESRAVVVGVARESFENWGHPWSLAS